MYEAFYGLRQRAFVLTPDLAFFLLTPKHREILSLVDYALAGSAGLALIVGEPGSGKTMLLRAALDGPRRDDGFVLLDNPALTRDEFLEFLAGSFGLGGEVLGSKTRVLRELRRVLAERREAGRGSALVIDEAQCLSDELLEEVRLLVNLDSRGSRLLPIVMAGHPELADRLSEPALSPLKQRVELRAVLDPLSLTETADYVAGRLRLAGCAAIEATFTPAAVSAVFSASGGIPRTINVICESALVAGFAGAARPIDREVVAEVCRDLDLDLAVVERESPAGGGGANAAGALAPKPAASPELARRPEADGTETAPAAEPLMPGPPAEGAESAVRGAPGPPPTAGEPATVQPPVQPLLRRLAMRLFGRARSLDAKRRSTPEPLPASAGAPAGRAPARRAALWRFATRLARLTRRRPAGPEPLQVEYFQVGDCRGFLMTPTGRGDR